jgi:hypothetical protein
MPGSARSGQHSTYPRAVLLQEVTYLPVTPFMGVAAFMVIALILVPLMGAVAQRHLGWVLVIVLVPPVGGLAWWLAQGVVWARLRLRLPAARAT